jgi:transcriptional regulator with XRE-family HTH domain
MRERRERFGTNLKRARKRADLSQEELSFRADLNRTTISLYERGLREPGIDAILKMAAVLETTPEALFEGIEWEQKKQRFKVQKPR